MQKTEVWCVGWLVRDDQHRVTGKTEWCAAASQRHPPREEADNIATKCKQYVTFPCGVEKRAPTCEECLTEVEKTMSKKTTKKTASKRRD